MGSIGHHFGADTWGGNALLSNHYDFPVPVVTQLLDLFLVKKLPGG
jgi:hypothetical protein